jgi:hypothetical protein
LTVTLNLARHIRPALAALAAFSASTAASAAESVDSASQALSSAYQDLYKAFRSPKGPKDPAAAERLSESMLTPATDRVRDAIERQNVRDPAGGRASEGSGSRESARYPELAAQGGGERAPARENPALDGQGIPPILSFPGRKQAPERRPAAAPRRR